MGYGGIALFIWLPCLVQAASSACLPNSCLVVPILVAIQEIHRTIYIVSHIVCHNAPKIHQVNEVPPLPKGSLFYTKHLKEIVQDF